MVFPDGQLYNADSQNNEKEKPMTTYIFKIITLLGGLALFLFGMDVMGKALERTAGGRLQTILAKMSSNVFKGFLLGLGVTAVIQSSSARCY